jgi:hypothetical protein
LLSSYTFIPQQELGEVNAVFKFTTFHQLEYAITFIEADRIIDVLDDFPVLANGIYLIIDTIQAASHLTPLDASVGKTIADILQHYLHTVDVGSIIIYNCDDRDGKQQKRFHKFNRWFIQYSQSMDLIKIDKEILIPAFSEESGDYYQTAFISFIYAKGHPRKAFVENELILLERRIMCDK